jgi:DNA invertase Pin-like site-specific DNA recombinase
MTKMRAYAYVRVSSDRQEHDRQVAAIETYARRERIEVAQWFSEKASGTLGAEGRAALRELLAELALDGVTPVLVEASDRVGRDVAVLEELAKACVKLGVTVREVTTGAPWVSPESEATADGRMVRRMKDVIAAHARDLIVERLAEGRARKRADTSRCEGKKPYGHHPGEAEVLDRMRQLYRKPRGRPRRSFGGIARLLNAEGHLSRTGRPWSSTVVRRILRRI